MGGGVGVGMGVGGMGWDGGGGGWHGNRGVYRVDGWGGDGVWGWGWGRGRGWDGDGVEEEEDGNGNGNGNGNGTDFVELLPAGFVGYRSCVLSVRQVQGEPVIAELRGIFGASELGVLVVPRVVPNLRHGLGPSKGHEFRPALGLGEGEWGWSEALQDALSVLKWRGPEGTVRG
jgi:hypothetical protein